MDVIEKIEKLRKEKGWSVNYLANEAMLTQSTIQSMLKRNTPPKIDILESICDALGITLSEFFAESGKVTTLTEDEIEVISLYRKLPKYKKQCLKEFLK